MNYVIRHGRKIEVVTVNPDVDGPPKRRKAAEAFVLIPLNWIAAAAKAAEAPAALVLIELKYAAWKAKEKPFKLPSAKLKRLGISRKVQHRVLRNLKSAGMVSVEQHPGRLPVLNLLT